MRPSVGAVCCRCGLRSCDRDEQRGGAQDKRGVDGADVPDESVGYLVADILPGRAEQEPAQEVSPRLVQRQILKFVQEWVQTWILARISGRLQPVDSLVKLQQKDSRCGFDLRGDHVDACLVVTGPEVAESAGETERQKLVALPAVGSNPTPATDHSS